MNSNIKKNLLYLLYSIILHIIIIFAFYFSKTSVNITSSTEKTDQFLTIKSIKQEVLRDNLASKKQIVEKQKNTIINQKKIKKKLKKPPTSKIKKTKKPQPLQKKIIKQKTTIIDHKPKKIITKNKEGLSYREEDHKPKKIITKNKEGLSYREEENIKNQITRCYRKTLSNNRLTKHKSEALVKISIDKYGIINPIYNFVSIKTVQNNPIIIKKIEKSIKEALIFCSPIRNLPKNKYQIWKNRVIKFENL